MLKTNVNQEIKLVVLSLEKLSELSIETMQKYDTIAIDEAQFFPDLFEHVILYVNKYKKRVLVAGLDGDSDQRNFGEIYKLIPWADKIEKICGFCQVCSEKNPRLMVEAPFTYLKLKKENVILIGSDIYQTLCRECLIHSQTS